MITFTEADGKVTLEMDQADWDVFVFMCGWAAGHASRLGLAETFAKWIEFVNDVNRTNPRFVPYRADAGEDKTQ